MQIFCVTAVSALKKVKSRWWSGPNGAGKSTAMKAIFGMLNLRSGTVTLDGEDITALMPQERVLKGMGFVPQTQNVFGLTVLENLEMGAFIRSDDISQTLEQIFDLFPILAEKAEQQASYLAVSANEFANGRGADDTAKGIDAG